MFFQFNFSIKIYFYYFLVPDLRDEKERLSDSNSREKNIVDNNFSHQNDRFLCQMILFYEKGLTYIFFYSLEMSKKQI